jgi:hypothetical protein
MKVKVNEDASVATGTDKPVDFKAGVVEVTDKNRAAVQALLDAGLAEPVKSAKGE